MFKRKLSKRAVSKNKMPQKLLFQHRIKFLAKLILLAFIFGAAFVGYVVFYPYHIPNNSYQLIVNKDEGIPAIAEDLAKHDIIQSKFMFRELLRLLGKDKKVTAGLYFLKNSASIWALVHRITNGKPDQISVTIIDGWSFTQLQSYINSLQNIQHITSKYSQDEIKVALKISYANLEGAFYPSTYFVAPNQTDLEIYQQAYRLMQNKLVNYYTTRSTSTSYTNPYQLLTMASLIQKETSNNQDMVLVSTVFNNRLRKGMKLQDDPSVFYGLRHLPSVTRKDFQIDTPYNTYLRYGLPPTPICIPSNAALLAASQPLDKPELLFFVAIGAGKTKFSNTYSEHKSAINKYLKKN
ncbi:MAG: hypothetical protein QG673_1041 [Pseudomonadota bacterium]|nr:hypothetical protein [Pseudomonadota bacterium]